MTGRRPRLSIGLAILMLAAVAAPVRGEPPAGPAAAPPAAKKPRDAGALLATIRAKHALPAMAGVIVLGDGTITAAGVDGVRRKGSAEKATLADKWHLGSCTKSMTATLVARLVEEKTLAWGATVGDIPLLESKRLSGGGTLTYRVDVPDAWKPITIVRLLHHRGGAPPNLDAEGLWTALWKFKGTPSEARMALVRGVVKHPPAGAPEPPYVYSNAGYAMAGAMAEAASGKAWENLLKEKVFAPLGITTAGYGSPGVASRNDQPRGHGADGKPVEPGFLADNPVAIGPAGVVHMSIGDWAKYAAAHVSGESTGKLLSKESWKILHTPVEGGGHRYAMGWGVGGGPMLTHSGSNTMWYCVATLYPSEGFGVLVTTNQGGNAGKDACNEAIAALLDDHREHEGKPN